MLKKSAGMHGSTDAGYQHATGPIPTRLTNDYLFKALLQKNACVLKSLICSLLHYSPDHVKDTTITNPIILGEDITDKSVVLDVNVTFNSGSRINLEMQVVNEKNWPERSTYYACKNFTDLNKGEKYVFVKPVFQIGFLDFTLFKDHPRFYSTYRLTEAREHYAFTNKLSIGIVDLTCIALATPEDKRYNIDAWAKLFKARTWEDIKMLAAQDVNISEAAATLYQLSADERIQQECEAREDYWKRQSGMEDLIAEQAKALAEKDAEIERLKALLASKA